MGGEGPSVSFVLDGRPVEVEDGGSTLLEALREQLACRTVKDGCSPQGQCGCCTVLVDGAARVSCVTPVRRVRGRSVTTIEGLPPSQRDRWVGAFLATGASQCGFCTPGILLRLAALEDRLDVLDPPSVRTALLAHLCRCTGWQSIVEAATALPGTGPPVADPGTAERGMAGPVPAGGGGPDRESDGGPAPCGTTMSPARPPQRSLGGGGRDRLLAEWRAEIEGRSVQAVAPGVVAGGGGFSDDRTPDGALVAVLDPDGTAVVRPSLREARRSAGQVPGRRSTVAVVHPLEVPEGRWALTLRTTWVEPAYLEPDASWCVPGGTPAPVLANGGAFGGKRASPVAAMARALADEHGRPVRVVWSREDVVRRGPKRPPIALGVDGEGRGLLRLAWTEGSDGVDEWCDAFHAVLPDVGIEVVGVAGPPVSAAPRAAGWGEAGVVSAALGWLAGPGRRRPPVVEVTAPSGGWARVGVEADRVVVRVRAGQALDEVSLRSYCLGAVHQGLGWVRSEAIAVDPAGTVHDLTIRSFGIVSARDMPEVEVVVDESDLFPVRGSDAVFVATAAADWIQRGLPTDWPVEPGGRPPVASGAR